MNDYLESLRDVERRIQKAEEQSAKELPDVDQPAGMPDGFEPHVQLLYDLQLLAYQSDLTRVITFMYGREQTGRPYPQIGVPEPHHPLTHHQNDPVKMEKCTVIQTYHISLFAEYLEKLRATPDGDGSLLDHIDPAVRRRHQQQRPPHARSAADAAARAAARGRSRAAAISSIPTTRR